MRLIFIVHIGALDNTFSLNKSLHLHVHMYSDNRVNMFTYKQCSSGRKMVDFVTTQSSSPRTRFQVIQMWQALLTEGVIEHGEQSHPNFTPYSKYGLA